MWWSAHCSLVERCRKDPRPPFRTHGRPWVVEGTRDVVGSGLLHTVIATGYGQWTEERTRDGFEVVGHIRFPPGPHQPLGPVLDGHGRKDEVESPWDPGRTPVGRPSGYHGRPSPTGTVESPRVRVREPGTGQTTLPRVSVCHDHTPPVSRVDVYVACVTLTRTWGIKLS